MKLAEKRNLTGRPLILDGAIGSYLQHNVGINSEPHLWMSSVNVEKKEVLTNLYREYITSGADILTTNTFGTNPYSINKSEVEYSPDDIISGAFDAVKDAIGDNNNILIAASNSPAEDCYSPDRTISLVELLQNHTIQLEKLYSHKPDLIINETFSHSDEIDIVCGLCEDINIPYIISLYFNDDLRILSGEHIITVIDHIRNNFSPEVISLNCCKVQNFERLHNAYKFDFPWGLYLNCGNEEINTGDIQSCISPDIYANTVNRFRNDNTFMIGSCCGSTPAHTNKLRELLSEKN